MSRGLGQQNYAAGAANLEARAALWSYALPAALPERHFLDLVAWRGDERVVDVGTGSGRFLGALASRVGQVVALDRSPAMLADAAARVVAAGAACLVGDVCALPFPDATVDGALAAWMLYHAASPDRAVAELRRILRPGAPLLAVTNAAAHTAELDRIGLEASERLLGPGLGWRLPPNRFTADDATAMLTRHFDDVVLHPWRRVLHVPAAVPVVAYLASVSDFADAHLAAHGATFADLVPHLEAVCAEQVAAHGHIEVTGLSVAAVCR